MKKPPKQRSEEDTKFLQDSFQSIKFFVDVNEEISPHLIPKLYRELRHEYFMKRSTIFQIGNPGSKFYIILKGTVQVLLEKTGFKEDVEELFSGPSHKYMDEEFKLIDNIMTLKDIEKGTFEELEETDKDEALSFLRKQLWEFDKTYSRKSYSEKENLAISKFVRKLNNFEQGSKYLEFQRDRVKIPEEFINILTDRDFLSLMFPNLVLTNELGIGDSFGELALKRDIPRL
jgi:CRP-like cAMP-binding protein